VRGAILPWVMAAVAVVIGLPLFFEVGLVLMAPIIFVMARRSGKQILSIQHSDEVEERFPLCNLGVIHALQIGDQPRPCWIPAQILPRLFA